MQLALNNKHSQTGKISLGTGLVLLLVWFAALGVIFTQRQAITDYLALRGYEAPARIAELAREDAMTDDARRVFYVNKPELVSRQDFASKCPNSLREQTIVLGCYHGNQNGIYLLEVEDPRLEGVEQVTAAHEMLHAFYDRLGSDEKKRVDAMLMDYYQNELADERIKTTIEGYKKTEPRDIVNEMHSIFGTEVIDLPSDLEEYYKQYFADRTAVLGYMTQYEKEFSSRRAQIAATDVRLVELKQQIEDSERQLKAQQEEIANRRSELMEQQSQGDTESFNAGVPAYNALVVDYNNGVARVQMLVGQYNELVESRNAIAAEISELTEALSANVRPIGNQAN